MNPPPDHVAATVDVPLKRSSTAITLVPELPGLPCVANHEIIVCVTSWGEKDPPLMPQIVRGDLGLVTSASTGLGAPWSSRTASSATGLPPQLACRAAQAGTTTGLGWGLGEGDGLGLGVSVGVALGLAARLGLCLAVGLFTGASGPLAVQPERAARNRRRTTPILTTDSNEQGCACVTRYPSGGESHRIPQGRLAPS